MSYIISTLLPIHEKIVGLPFVFLGIAENIRLEEKAPFPFGSVDIFRLSKHKTHYFFPVSLRDLIWIFLIDEKTTLEIGTEKNRIEIFSETDERLFYVDILGPGILDCKTHPEVRFSTQPITPITFCLTFVCANALIVPNTVAAPAISVLISCICG